MLASVGLRSSSHRHQHHGQVNITRRAVPFIHCLRIIHTPIQARHKILCETDECLDSQEGVGDQSELSVQGSEVWCLVGKFVVLDHYEGGDEGVDGEEIEREVCQCAGAFLGLGVCGLQDEDCLCR